MMEWWRAYEADMRVLWAYFIDSCDRFAAKTSEVVQLEKQVCVDRYSLTGEGGFAFMAGLVLLYVADNLAIVCREGRPSGLWPVVLRVVGMSLAKEMPTLRRLI